MKFHGWTPTRQENYGVLTEVKRQTEILNIERLSDVGKFRIVSVARFSVAQSAIALASQCDTNHTMLPLVIV